MNPPEVPRDNQLLALLSKVCGQGWQQQLQHVDLKLGQVLCEPGRSAHFAYFPTSAIVSMLYTTETGASAQVAVVGREGMVGTSVLLGGCGSTWQCPVLIAGQAFRIGAQALKDEFEKSAALRQVLLRYTHALVAQIGQTAVCNRHHAIEQQLCGWLLHGLDRLPGAEVVVTQELISGMLGVRRESVTQAAHHLQDAGLIHYARGHIVVMDRAGLEQRACECHAVVKKEYERLLLQDPAAGLAGPDRPTWTAWRAAA